MTADTLRRAATLIRERAEAATTHTPWQLLGLDDEHAPPWTVASTHPVGERTYVCQDARHAGPHIAGMHPAVALAVADWLEAEAQKVWFAWGHVEVISQNALAVARAYLGEEP